MTFIAFSTSDFAVSERLEAAQEVYSAISQVSLLTRRNQVPHVETRIRLLPGVSIANVTSSSLRAARESPQVVDGNDDITFLIHPGGEGGWLSHLKSHDSLALKPGGARLVFNHQSGSVDFFGERANFLSIAFPRAQLGPLIKQMDHLPKNLLPPSEPLHHLIRLALSLTACSDALEVSSTLSYSRQMLDLACLALVAKRDAAMHAQRGSLRDARLRAIKSDIKLHARSSLSLDQLASRHGVSPSYIRALFSSQGTSFTDYLLEQRLQLAFAMLTNPNARRRSISEIAFQSGFNHLSWFYRAFRNRFGCAPGEARAAADGCS